MFNRRWVAAASSLFSMVIAGLLLQTGRAAADNKPAAAAQAKIDPQLQPLARYVGGQWVVHGKWNNGPQLHAREIHELSLDGRIIRSRTFVTKDDGTEYQRYESINFWHPKKKQLMFHSYAFNGAIDEGLIEPQSDGSLLYPPAIGDDGKPGPIRQTIKFTDDDTMIWTVFKRNDDGSEETMIEATWKREPVIAALQ
jgi:hypothetical protein